jgi:hypothetical protein
MFVVFTVAGDRCSPQQPNTKTTVMLNQSELQSFHENGFLVLPNFFKAWETDAWRMEVENYYGAPKDYAGWQRAMQVFSNLGVNVHFGPSPKNHAKMKTLCTSFNQGIHWQGETELNAMVPQAQGRWSGPSHPNLDYPKVQWRRMLLNTVFYLNDVSEYEGPFMYWKGSHHIAWEYFKNKPAEYSAPGYLTQGQTFESLVDRMANDPVPFYAKAGDLLIYHPLLLHSPSSNVSHKPNLALRGTWGELIENPEEDYYDFSADMSKYWNFNAERPLALAV